MSKILIPTRSAEDWRHLLAQPDKHWKRGFSARTLAYCWQDADGLPGSVREVFAQSGIDAFAQLEVLFILPEHRIPLPGGSRPSQCDIWLLGRSPAGLVSIAVEGKVEEPFGPTLGEWLQDASSGKETRLAYLQEQLGLAGTTMEDVRYQLLHRTASAVIEAKRFGAPHAMMLVHSFSQTVSWFEDYERFLSLFGVKGVPNSVIKVVGREAPFLYFAWVRGEERYLEV